MIKIDYCIGCQSCIANCPTKAIHFEYDSWGQGNAFIDTKLCIKCEKCAKYCPALHLQVNEKKDYIYAMISNNNSITGSSGGVFYEMAKKMIIDGGIIYGAMFDENLKLVHKRVDNIQGILPLCKSKYIHSDMFGIYEQIKNDLSLGKKILFVGTPCQVSAVKNIFKNKSKDNLILVDFLCHGTGTQKIFDICIREEEHKINGKIKKFVFRSKTRKGEHSFFYEYEKGGKTKIKNGHFFEFSYYYSFLQYCIFNDYCYSCRYATKNRVGDITIGDFWGIQNYNKFLNDYEGVSLVSVNTEIGENFINKIDNQCTLYKYPIEYAVKYNQSLRKCEPYPNRKKELVKILNECGENKLFSELSCKNILKNKIYYKIPKSIIKLYRRLKYEKIRNK